MQTILPRTYFLKLSAEGGIILFPACILLIEHFSQTPWRNTDCENTDGFAGSVHAAGICTTLWISSMLPDNTRTLPPLNSINT